METAPAPTPAAVVVAAGTARLVPAADMAIALTEPAPVSVVVVVRLALRPASTVVGDAAHAPAPCHVGTPTVSHRNALGQAQHPW